MAARPHSAGRLWAGAMTLSWVRVTPSAGQALERDFRAAHRKRALGTYPPKSPGELSKEGNPGDGGAVLN